MVEISSVLRAASVKQQRSEQIQKQLEERQVAAVLHSKRNAFVTTSPLIMSQDHRARTSELKTQLTAMQTELERVKCDRDKAVRCGLT